MTPPHGEVLRHSEAAMQTLHSDERNPISRAVAGKPRRMLAATPGGLGSDARPVHGESLDAGSVASTVIYGLQAD